MHLTWQLWAACHRTFTEKLSVFLLLNLFFPSSLLLTLTCFVENISEQVSPHKDSRSHPTQASVHDWWQRPHSHEHEQSWCRWTVCMCVCICVCVCVCGPLTQDYIVTPKPWSFQMWGLLCLNVRVPVVLSVSLWKDQFNTVAIFSFYNPLLNLALIYVESEGCNHANACA